jgi:hypothetical protein
MFTKRTIKKRMTVHSVDTASEALALSIAEKAQSIWQSLQDLLRKSLLMI